MLVVGLWCLFNLVIAGAALGVVAERRQPERCPSLPVARTGRVSLGPVNFPVAVERVSAEGCTLRRTDGGTWPGTTRDGTLSVAAISGGATYDALPFRLRSGPAGDLQSVVFAGLSAGTYRSLADLMYADTTPLRAFLAGRRRHRDLLTGSLQFLAWGFGEPVRAISYALRNRATPVATLERARAPMPAASAASLAPATNVPDLVERLAPLPLIEIAAMSILAPPIPIVEPEAVAPAPATVAAAPATVALRAASWSAAIKNLAQEERIAVGTDVSTALDPAEWLAAILTLAGVEGVTPAASQAPTPSPVPIGRTTVSAPSVRDPLAIRHAA